MKKIIKAKKSSRNLQNNSFFKKKTSINSFKKKFFKKTKVHFNKVNKYSGSSEILFSKKKKNNFKNKDSSYNFKISSTNKINFLRQKFIKPKKNFNKKIVIKSQLTVFELAKKMGVKVSYLIKFMMDQKFTLTKNQVLKEDMALLIAEEMGRKVVLNKRNYFKNSLNLSKNNKNVNYFYRPPVVAIMGHVDHGKTALLNSIRKLQNINLESGGITQSIGAYHVNVKKKKITFLDTPGHKAFKDMRIRGVKITDIVVLVISVDDGVMPQTIEAIEHAQFVNVPIVVAINKIDKGRSEDNIIKIQNQLMKYNIISENLGGENIFVYVSAKFKTGISKLLNAILLQSEILNLKVKLSGSAKGIVIDSFLDKKKGPFISVLLKKGTLKKGSIILCGQEYGKIKLILNEFDKEINLVKPSIPVKILGLSILPSAGETLLEVQNEKIAKKISLLKKEKIKLRNTYRHKEVNFEEMFKNFNDLKNKNVINIFLKSNSKGSLEAICSSIKSLEKKFIDIKLNFSSVGIGSFTETDVNLATSCQAILIGFNVKYDFSAKKIIDSEKLIFKHYSIIYDVLKDIKKLIKSKLKFKFSEIEKGTAIVKNVFKISKSGLIAGSIVTEGKFKKIYKINLFRKNKKIHSGKILSLKRFKNDVNKVLLGQEFGILIKKYNDIKVGDIIKSFITN